MLNTRKTVKTFIRHDYATGNKINVAYRAYQPIKKDGADAKKDARCAQNCLMTYADGSYRYYNKNGVLARENVSAAQREAEINNYEGMAK